MRDELESAFVEIRSLETQIDLLHAELERGHSDGGEYSEAIERFALIGGYSYHALVDRVARGIGIFDLLDRPLLEVSGGERTKVALAKILLSSPDFLLLDEPTNFIDIDALMWLETYLTSEWKGGYLIISHDRMFLDLTTTETLVITEDARVIRYHGNYTQAKETREAEFANALKKYEEQQEFLKEEKTLINRFRAGSRAGFAKSREKMLDRVEILDRPIRKDGAKFQFLEAHTTGDKTIDMEEVFIGRKDPLFFARQAVMYRGERIGVIGENGVGKSTLIRTLLGQIPLLDGMLKVNPSLSIAYFSQMHEELEGSESIYALFERHGLCSTRDGLA